MVLGGAMRPATAISADGPMNLLNAVRVAADPQSVGKGVLITMNDVINNARDVTKTNTTNVATFRGGELGALGYIAGGKNYFYKESTRPHTYKSDFDIEKINKLPRVDIIYSHVNADRVLVDAAVAAGAKGIVAAGTGNGSISEREEAGLVDAMKKGVTVVRSARVQNGPTTASVARWQEEGILFSQALNPQKARMLLQLALTKTQDPKKIQEYFDKY